jgi:D-alanyl-D-alanine carboxypeptidase
MTKRKIIIGATLFVVLIGLFIFFNKESADAPASVTTTKAEPSFDTSKYSNSSSESIWVIVNKNRRLNPITYTPPDLTPVGNGQTMRKEAAAALQVMFQAATNEGLSLKPLSGYRSYTTQQTIYTNEVGRFGQSVADSQSAKPGYSEHQTGFAIDIGGGGCGIEDCFGNTAEGKWVAANAYKYGFIVRYIPGKESITGYRAEPWHIRYIGTELSNEMHKRGITTLEEFFSP